MLNEHSHERRKDYGSVALAEAFGADDLDRELEASFEEHEDERVAAVPGAGTDDVKQPIAQSS